MYVFNVDGPKNTVLFVLTEYNNIFEVLFYSHPFLKLSQHFSTKSKCNSLEKKNCSMIKFFFGKFACV
ncbi:hypothetical protein BpHYR1_022635 [Brachionus plicatilis]|uniref:Uncharacterized protein n=1 Tax=Brachionus plicatilis TaxID=10195 RepID=A0A3M7PBZ8_BRAPC|nr:hypothetical protein BpHYR1_022635 [Brachionus plicatilis]